MSWACLGLGSLLALGAGPAKDVPGAPWVSDFAIDPGQLASVGRNPFFILEPGYFLVLQEGSSEIVFRVLDETKLVQGVETRVLEERETWNGRTTEVSRNYVAIHKQTRDVFQFGEDVSNYRNGKVVSNAGTWLAGVKDAQAGLVLPGEARVGYRYFQEQAPGVTMDRAEVVSTTATLRTPAGTFEKCVRTRITSPMTPGAKEYRIYAPDIGLVQFESMLLVEHGFGSRPPKSGRGP